MKDKRKLCTTSTTFSKQLVVNRAIQGTVHIGLDTILVLGLLEPAKTDEHIGELVDVKTITTTHLRQVLSRESSPTR